MSDSPGALRSQSGGQDRLELVLAAADMGDWSWNAKSDMANLSPRAAEILGLPAGESMTWTAMRELLHPADRERARIGVERAVAERCQYQVEYRIRRRGEEVWIAASGRAHYDEAGTCIGMYGVVQDVTSLRRLQTALGESERRFRELMEQAPFSVQVLSAEGRTLRVNRAWEELWGLRLEDLQSYNVLADPQLETLGIAPYLRRAFEGEVVEIPPVEYDPRETLPQANRREDARRWVSAVAYPLHDQEGKLREVVLVHQDITARRRAEAALLASEERLRRATEAGRLLVWDVDLVARTVHCTGSAAEVWGMTEGSADAFFARVHPEDSERVRREGGATTRQGVPYSTEYRVIDPEGRVRWLHSRGDVLRERDGTPLRFIGVSAEITERKLAEESVARGGERLRLVTDAIPALISYVNADCRYEFNNRAYLDWFGQDPASLRGKHLREVLGEEAFRRLLPHITQALSGERTQIESEVPYLAGGRRFIKAEYVPDVRSDGTVAGYYALVQDITAAKLAEQALRESEARERARAAEMETFMKAVPAVIWVARDAECRVIEGNDNSYDLLRLPKGENASSSAPNGVAPSHFQVLVDGKVLTPEEMPVQRAARGEEVRSIEEEIRFLDGTSRFLFGNATPLRNGHGETCGAVAAFVDITERKRAEEALRDADRRKNEFLATLGHELRNPLAPIRNAVRYLSLNGPPIPDLQAARDMIERQVQHMVRLIDDLLDVSRITFGKLELRRQRVEFRSIVEQAIEAVRPHMERVEQRVTVDLPPENILVDADPVRLAQVIGNLLHNASKYSDRGREVHLQVRHSGNRLEVCVCDNGIGISAEDLPKVFEMFSQVSTSSDRAQGGLGVGLSLVKALVEMHGGMISAHSEGLGKGSTFRLDLPICVPPERPAAAGAVREQRDASRRRMLVVDDNRDSADSLAKLLAMRRHEVQVVYGGAEAIEAAEQFHPEVILLDIGMPDISGLDVARHVRQQAWSQRTTVIAMTGWGQAEDMRQTREAGCDRHLVKPLDFDVLTALLDELPER